MAMVAPPSPASLFWIEIALWVCYVPASYAAYRWARVPMRQERDLRAISRLDGLPADGGARPAALSHEDVLPHRLANFLWPLLVAMTIPTLVLLVYHPYTRPVNGALLDWVWPDCLNLGDRDKSHAAMARFAFWGFGGAFLYSFTMIWRRYMAMDITPNTYTYAGIRFLTSMFIGCTVGAVLGAGEAALGKVSDRALVPLCAVVFFIGMFPDFGMAYLRELARRTLGKGVEPDDEIPLLRVSGLDLWHESRFRQDGVNNAHNLANTDLPRLVRTFPFPVGQLVSWVDEALLITHVSEERLARLREAGVYGASAVLRALADPRRLPQLVAATHLDEDALAVLGLSLEQCMNMPRIMRFRGHYLKELGRATREAPACAGDPRHDTPSRIPFDPAP